MNRHVAVGVVVLALLAAGCGQEGTTQAPCVCDPARPQRLCIVEARWDGARAYFKLGRTNVPCCRPRFESTQWLAVALDRNAGGELVAAPAAAPNGSWLVISADGSIDGFVEGLRLLPVPAGDVALTARRFELYTVHSMASGEFRGTIVVEGSSLGPSTSR